MKLQSGVRVRCYHRGRRMFADVTAVGPRGAVATAENGDEIALPWKLYERAPRDHDGAWWFTEDDPGVCAERPAYRGDA